MESRTIFTSATGPVMLLLGACSSTATIPKSWGNINDKPVKVASSVNGSYRNNCDLSYAKRAENYGWFLSERLGGTKEDAKRIESIQLKATNTSEVTATFIEASGQPSRVIKMPVAIEEGWLKLKSQTSPHLNNSGAIGVGTLTTSLSLRTANDKSLIVRIDETQNLVGFIPIPIPVHIEAGSFLRCEAAAPTLRVKK